MIRIMTDNNTNKILSADVTCKAYENYVTVTTDNVNDNNDGYHKYVYYYIDTDDMIKAINHVKLFLKI